MSKPTGFAAKCRCGIYVGALDAARTDRADMGKILGEWLFKGMTVEPRFTGTWSVEIESCRCTSQETSSAPSPSVLDRLVTVCGACETAACWQGSFMCDSAEMAGIKNLTVRDLHEKPRGENAEYWFKDGDGKIDKTLLEIYQRLTSQNRGESL